MKKVFLFAFIIMLMHVPAYAFHPLNTDDTGTAGKGHGKVQLLGKFAHNEANDVVESSSKIKASFTYGVAENIDIEVGQPYKFKKEDYNGVVTKTDGIADAEIELKWRFYEHEHLSFALRPSLTLPSGDSDKGLGAGKVTYGLFLLATKEIDQWAFHFNAGYERTANKADDRPNIRHLSAAAEHELGKGFVLAAEIGTHSNEEKASNLYPVYTTAAVLYSPVKNIKFDLGVRLGLNRAEPDYTILPGITVKF